MVLSKKVADAILVLRHLVKEEKSQNSKLPLLGEGIDSKKAAIVPTVNLLMKECKSFEKQLSVSAGGKPATDEADQVKALKLEMKEKDAKIEKLASAVDKNNSTKAPGSTPTNVVNTRKSTQPANSAADDKVYEDTDPGSQVPSWLKAGSIAKAYKAKKYNKVLSYEPKVRKGLDIANIYGPPDNLLPGDILPDGTKYEGKDTTAACSSPNRVKFINFQGKPQTTCDVNEWEFLLTESEPTARQESEHLSAKLACIFNRKKVMYSLPQTMRQGEGPKNPSITEYARKFPDTRPQTYNTRGYNWVINPGQKCFGKYSLSGRGSNENQICMRKDGKEDGRVLHDGHFTDTMATDNNLVDTVVTVFTAILQKSSDFLNVFCTGACKGHIHSSSLLGPACDEYYNVKERNPTFDIPADYWSNFINTTYPTRTALLLKPNVETGTGTKSLCLPLEMCPFGQSTGICDPERYEGYGLKTNQRTKAGTKSQGAGSAGPSKTVASKPLRNEGKGCWNQCQKKNGACPSFCGGGLCCRKGHKGGGCTGAMGSRWSHKCIAKPVESRLAEGRVGKRLKESNSFFKAHAITLKNRQQAMLIKKILTTIKGLFYKVNGKQAPRCQKVIKKQGNIDWLAENLYTKDGGWAKNMGPGSEPFGKLVSFGKLWLAQFARDKWSCQGQTQIGLFHLRNTCKAFASIAQVDAPTILEPQRKKKGNGGGLWGDDRHNFERMPLGTSVHRVLWSEVDPKGEPIPGKSKPIGTRFIAKKCAKVLPESWAGITSAQGLCYAQMTPATTKHGKEIQKVRGASLCTESCDPGVEADCVAQIDWKYDMCTTCCCKGGVGFKSKVDVSLIHIKKGKGCGKWFQIMDLLFNAIANAATRGDAIFNWSSRCVKF